MNRKVRQRNKKLQADCDQLKKKVQDLETENSALKEDTGGLEQRCRELEDRLEQAGKQHLEDVDKLNLQHTTELETLVNSLKDKDLKLEELSLTSQQLEDEARGLKKLVRERDLALEEISQIHANELKVSSNVSFGLSDEGLRDIFLLKELPTSYTIYMYWIKDKVGHVNN